MTRLKDLLALPKITHNLAQGTPAWDQFRLQHRGASEAAAALGLSKKMKRSELLHMKHTGVPREFSDWLQKNVLDKGHELEALARPIIEQILGEELYPVTCSRGNLSASCDGLTMDDATAFEHKQWNEELAAAVRAGELPDEQWPQCQQILLVTGAERLIFAVSDGTPDRLVHMIVLPDRDRWAVLAAGWDQFDADLAVYTPPEPVQKLVAEPVQALPAVAVHVAGEIAIRDNFKAFEVALRDFLEHRLIREPKTDQQFADLEVQIKAMKGAEAALESAESQMLAQIQSVDQAKKTKEMLHKLVRDNRLMAEKLLTSEKERRRTEIVAGGIRALAEHVTALNQRLGKPYMPPFSGDFAGVVKGLKTVASMEEKVAAELARAKIAANEIADRIDVNLKHLREHAEAFKQLFPDTAAIVLKAPDDLHALVSARIAEHKADQERKLEAERARIRAEEQARADREARERAAAEERERQEKEAAERRQREEADAQLRQKQSDHDRINDEGAARLHAEMKGGASKVLPMPTKAPAAGPVVRIPLGEVNKRLAVNGVEPTFSAAFLAALGFQHEAGERGSKLYDEARVPLMCSVLVQHFAALANGRKEAA